MPSTSKLGAGLLLVAVWITFARERTLNALGQRRPGDSIGFESGLVTRGKSALPTNGLSESLFELRVIAGVI